MEENTFIVGELVRIKGTDHVLVVTYVNAGYPEVVDLRAQDNDPDASRLPPFDIEWFPALWLESAE